MLTIALIAAFAALASAEVKYTCGEFSAHADGPGYGATGSVELFETAEGVKVVGKDLQVTKDDVPHDATYVAHVHALACADGAGGHWEINSTVEGVVESNELWVGPQAQAGDAKWGNLDKQNEYTAGTFVDNVPLSFLIHEASAEGAKRVCCDLAVPATTTTDTAAATTAPAGNTTAAATTAADPNCANADSPADCCAALNDLKQEAGKEFNADLDNCGMCIKNAGCEFYRNVGGSVAELKTECVPPGTDTSVTLTKVEKVDECDNEGEICDDLECEDCLALEACVWCDTGAKIGLSTGSCTDTKCTSGVDPSTECSGASIASVAALAVAAAAALKL